MSARWSLAAFRAFQAPARHQIEDEIEWLLALLDTLDGDPDFEPETDKEPSLGWTSTMALGSSDDREEQVR